MDVLKIVLGTVVTVFGFYATSCLLLAQKQLAAATRLNGYLRYWQNWILEYGISKVYALGIVWNQENLEVQKRGGDVTELMQLEEQRKVQLNLIKELIEKGMDLGFDKRRVMRQVRDLSRESVEDYARQTRQNLVEGKTFTSDEEATTLGVSFTVKCIELKMGLIDLIEGATSLLITIMSHPDDFETREYAEEIASLVWKGICLSRNIDLVSRAAGATASKSLVSLTWQNIVTGGRFTKR